MKTNRTPFLSFLSLALTLTLLGSSESAVQNEIGFIETFALAENREEALKQLIPGSEEYFFYHALHYQNTSAADKLKNILADWSKRYPNSGLRLEILHRDALLGYDADPKATIAYLKDKLGLRFDHAQEVLDKKPDLPTALNPSVIARDTLLRQALAEKRNLSRVNNHGLDWILRNNVELTAPQRRDLLNRLRRPDYDNLVDLIAAEMNTRESRGFGEFAIHGALLPKQLDELLGKIPNLIKNEKFVFTYLQKLQPSADVDLDRSNEEKAAYLARAWNFVKDLAPSFNSLKAHVLYRQLSLDLESGKYDRQKFIDYIKLPRRIGYVNPDYLKVKDELRLHPVNLGADYSAATRCRPIGSDEALIREFLLHFFVDDNSIDAFSEYIRDTYLKPIFAEAKIVNGVGDQQKWYSMLSPAAYKALKERVDIDFLRTNKKRFAIGDDVSLDLHVKNVEKLIVKVYEINALNYFLENGRQINTDLNLDGLVANEEKIVSFNESPLRRVKRTFDFPNLKGERGVWIVEFIGNSKSSRALIRKGALSYVSRTGTAGEVFTVLDESHQVLKDATIWSSGREYKPDEHGEIAIPFSNAPGKTRIILTWKNFATLADFDLKSENYAFTAGFHVDQESLLEGSEARVAIRPALTVNGIPVTLSVLEEVTLQITSTNVDGISTTSVVENFKVEEGGESTHQFAVPARLQRLHFHLSARVQNISQDKKIPLSAANQFNVNQIDRTVQVPALLLSKIGNQFVVELFGRSGEPRADTAVRIVLFHHDFPGAVHAMLRTDDKGRIQLGELIDIDRMQAVSDGLANGNWTLPVDRHSRSAYIHARTGDVIHIPYEGSAGKVTPEEVALFEVRGGTYFANKLAATEIAGGLIRISGLEPGDYQFHLKRRNYAATIRVTDGDRVGRYVVGKNRSLEILNPKPVQVAELRADEGNLTIKVAHANKLTRVHVVAGRFVPAFDLYQLLGQFAGIEPLHGTPALHPSLYLSGRKIGDEYRYILQRKFAKIFPGNMLTRPGLLLNPWELRKTETRIDDAKEGQKWSQSAVGKAAGKDRAAAKQPGGIAGLNAFPNLNFLANSSPVVLNLRPDKDGLITIKIADLGDRQHVHVLAVDPFNSSYREISLPDAGTKFSDLRLNPGLDPKVHFTEQREVKILKPGDKLKVDDILNAEFESYETIGGIFSLFRTLNGDPTLVEFDFILRWPKMEEKEKREKYSRYASHELHFFLSRKDPEFFKQVVLPYIANKKDKTFMDHYLLEADLTPYLQPWKFSKLNVVERVLLGDRFPDRKASIARSLKDLDDLRPPNEVEDIRLFSTALSGKSLEAGETAIEAEVRKIAPPRAPARQAGNRMAAGPANKPAGLAAAEPPAGAAMDKAAPADGVRRNLSKRKASARDGANAEAEEVQTKNGALALKKLEEKSKELRQQSAPGVDDLDAGGEYFKRDERLRAKVRTFYRKMAVTSEWAENNYYHIPIENQNADLVRINSFWADYAARDGNAPFVSRHTTQAVSNFTEMMLALAVLDLPFEGAKHEVKIEKKTLSVTAAGPILVFHKEIKQAGMAEEETPLLVSQNYYREGDRYIQVNNEKRDKFVTEEFLSGVVYGCQIVATNPTSSNQKLDILRQIPAGAIPVNGSRETTSSHLALAPYSTQTMEFHFYFPAAGDYRIFPVHLSKSEDVVAFGRPFTFKVVDKLSKIDKASWDYISQWGSTEDVIRFLEQHNLNRTNLDRIAWRMKDLNFFRTVIGLIESRFSYNQTLYSYGLYHNELKPMRQFLLHSDGFLNQCGPFLDCKLVTIDPVERRSYQHLEYSPLVNARAHMLGKDRKILNDRFRGQYQALMRIFSYKAQLDVHDRMTVVYYQFLQDRVEEALAMLGTVKREELPTQLQFDYFDCYAAFYLESPDRARTVAAKYADYPVDRWQKLFAQVTAQVDEVEGKGVKVADDENRNQKQDELAATEPSFDLKVEDKKVALTYQNVESATVNYYRMDLEFLFSSNPFVSQDSGRFSIIKPNQTVVLKLDKDKDAHTFELPAEFQNTNVLVEVVAAGQKKAQAYYSNALKVQLVENYGRLQVRHSDSGKPLSKVYVKVYARLANGQTKFFKDGYTDLRGKFDYTSLNTDELGSAQKFGILIMSDEHGALVKEADPPKQ